MLLFLRLASPSDLFRIATYNSMKFPESFAQVRLPYFRTVVQAVNPDILVMQEFTSAEGIDLFFNQVLNTEEPFLYSAAPYHDGYDTDNVLFFKSRSFSLESSRHVKTSLRDISEFILRPRLQKNMPNIWIYSAHLRAGSDIGRDLERLEESTILRNELDNSPPDTPFFVVGDLNFYTHQEPGFIALTSNNDQGNPCFDPSDQIGEWHNNKYFARYHTQSTRMNELYGGSTGGLDDRFDFILVSQALKQSPGYSCVQGSYQSFGNDGLHFNTSINNGRNLVVPDSVADALYHASDHLPVVLDVEWYESVRIDHGGADSWINPGVSTFPNPFNDQTCIRYILSQPDYVVVTVHNIKGEKIIDLVNEFKSAGEYTISWFSEDQTSGIYIINVQTHQNRFTTKVILLK